MTVKAIILPLDGVLFHNTIAEYERTCLQIEAEFVDPAVAAAARVAVGKLAGSEREPALSNDALLQAMMRRELGAAAAKLEPHNAQFHAEAFPSLRVQSSAAPAISALLAALSERALLRAILAEVCFSEEAARQRLDWAELGSEDWEFVAHSENTHFDAAAPALFAEIIARLGVEPDETIFVGATGARELTAARAAGPFVYELIPAGQAPAEASDSGGTMVELAARIRSGWLAELRPRPITRAQVFAELRGNLGALYGLLDEVGAEQWHMHPDEDEWSIVQILCHLLERERSEQLPRLRRIAAEDEPFLVAPSPAGPKAEPCAADGWPVAAEFAAARAETLAYLAELAPDDWRRPARHSIFGPTNLLEMAHFTAQHDRLHLNQLCQTLGKCD